MAAQIVAPAAKVAARPRLWDLRQFFGLADVNVFSPGWLTFARGIGSTFIFIMGVSLTPDAA